MALVPYAGEILKEKPLNLTPYTGEILPELPTKKPEPPPVPEQQGPRVLGPEDTSSDFMRGITNYLPQLQETFGGAQVLAGRLAQKVGAEETGGDLIKRGVENLHKAESKTVVRKTDEFMEALKEGIVPLITDWLPYQIGSGAANLAETLGMMAVGAGVGAATGAGVGALPGAISGAVAKSLVKKGILEAAENMTKEKAEKHILDAAKKELIALGSTAGIGSQAVLHGAGETTSRAVQEAQRNNQTPEDINLGRLVPAAIVHSVADFFVSKIGVNALKVGEKAADSLIAEVAKRIAVTGGKEILPEEIQTAAERFGANLSLADAEALKEYVNTAAAAVGMSVLPGTVGGVRNHFSNQFAKAAKEQAEREETEKQKQQTTAPAVIPPATTTPATAADIELNSLTNLQNAPPPPPPGAVTTTTENLSPPGAITTTTENPPPAPPADETQTAPPPPPAETKPKLQNAPIPSKVDIEANPIAAATKYIEDLDSTGGKANALPLKQLEKLFGLTIEPGKGFNDRAVAAIRQHLAQQGAPNVPTGTITPSVGESPSVATQPDTGAAAEGVAAVDTSGVGNVEPSITATNVGEGTQPAPVVPLVAGDIGLQDLAQTDRDLVATQRDIYNKIAYAYAKDPSKINTAKLKDALADLHELEDAFEITRSDPLTADDNFFAEPIGPFRSRQEQRDAANDYALSLEREEERKQEEQRQRDLEASYLDKKGKPRGPLKYSFDTDEMENQYNQTYAEIAAEAKTKNAERVELAIAQEEAKEKFNAAKEKAEQIEAELKTAREQNNESRIQELEKEQEKADNEEADTSSALAEAEVALERHGPRLSQLSPWSKVSAAEKDLYFSLIKYGNRPEHREAGKKLQAYRALTQGREEGYIKPKNEQERKEQEARKERDQRRERVTSNYEYNREAVAKHFKFEFPSWNKLSHATKLTYLQALSEKGDTNDAGIQQDYAFARVAERLINENNKLTKKEKDKALIDYAKRVSEMIGAGIAAQDKFQRQRDTAEPYVPFSKVAEDRPLSAEAIKLIKDNELQKLLQAFRSAPTGGNLTALVHKGLAQALFAMKLSTTLEIVDVIRDNKGRETDAYGSYDPLTNKIRLAPNGLTMSTVLHELTHAATVQVLYKYSHGNQLRSQLTEDQILACFQLEQLMEEAKDYLGKTYPTAFKNVYEFIAYAMTEPQFQRELNRISPSAMGAMKASNIVASAIQDKLGKEPGKIVGKWREWTETLVYESLLPTARSLWTSLSRAIAKAVGYNADKQANGQINFLVEVSEIFSKIAMPQQGPIELGRLEATAPPGQQPPQAPPTRIIDLDDDADPNYRRFEEKKIPLFTAVKNAFTTKQGFVQLATKFANNRYASKVWEKARERAGLINFDGPLINAVYTLLTLAPSRGRSIYYKEIAPISSELRASLEEYAKAMNLDVNQVLARLHKIMEVLHNPERSMVKFLLSAPLDDKKKLFMVSGKPSSAADVRTAILNQLNRSQNMTQAQALQLRSTLESIVFQTQVDPSGQVTIMRDANGNPLVNANNVVATGFSPDNIKEIDPSHQTFNMANLDPTSVRNVTTQYLNDPNKALVDKIISDMRRLNEKTIELDKQSNYWSKPVDNRKNFYNFQNYISFKGKGAHTQTDEMLNFETMKRGGNDFQQIERPMSGRETAGDNPILHAMAYAVQAALRAGRKDVTLAIKNAIEQGLMSGRVSKKKSFEERDDPKFIESLPKERTLFHFNEDGSLQVLEINDDALRESIRRTFESTNPLIGAANWLTSKVGATHTRYNFNFAPMNFVRDGLTNAGAIGADMGPKKAAEYLGAMSSLVANGGLYKAMQVAVLYDKSDVKSQQALKGLANSDPFIANMVEFIKEGGMVSYLHGLTVKSNFEQLYKEVGRSGILTKVEQLEKFIDVWTDMFELASRSAAYSVAKADAYANNITGDAAKTKAAAYAKNLANFEQVGDWGKALGSLYMFFRPSATGALRAIEAIAPAFRTADRAFLSLQAELPTDYFTQNPNAKAEFLANYDKNRKNAQIMTASLMGLGALAYTMAFMFADDDDDLGRNPVGTDNMQQWTRYARFHVPKVLSEAIGLKDPLVLQMPWGFGLGAFAASGAQLAAAVAGKQSFGDALANIFLQISLDSFVPIPISRMPATEMPGAFILDSIAPSVLRPVFEFVINKNGLGQEIYNDQNRRMGDAYTGGDHIPEIYKEAARWMANNTVGDIDISPNTLYFLSNSYLDGIAKFFEVGNDAALLLSGKKDFKPKTDLPLFGSFFGSRSNVDSREYSAVEKKIEDIEKKIKQFDTDPLMAAKYDIKHPLHRTLVDMYNHDKNQELRDLRHEAKQIRLNTAFDPKDRDAMIKIINMQQNLVKYRLVQIYKAYGVEP
jgi:predicted hydrocarbon binding protein